LARIEILAFATIENRLVTNYESLSSIQTGSPMAFAMFQLLSSGEKITVNDALSLNVPNRPIIPFIEGDGIGVDISR